MRLVALLAVLVLGAQRCRADVARHPHDASRASRDRFHPDAYQRKCNHLAWTAVLKAHGGPVLWPPTFCKGAGAVNEWDFVQPATLPGQPRHAEYWSHGHRLAIIVPNETTPPNPPQPTLTMHVIDKRPCATLEHIPATHTWREDGVYLSEIYCREPAGFGQPLPSAARSQP